MQIIVVSVYLWFLNHIQKIPDNKLFKDTQKAYFGDVIRCSTLQLCVGYFVYFRFTPVFF